jgi:hypothetical protein
MKYTIRLKGEEIARNVEAYSQDHAVQLIKQEAAEWLQQGKNQVSGNSSEGNYRNYAPPVVLQAKHEDFEVLVTS